MYLGIIGIILGLVAIGLILYFRKDQKTNNDLFEGDIEAARHAYNALQKDFSNYQVDTDRKIAHLEKQQEIKSNENERKIMRLTQELPKVIRNVVGHIEFARPLDKK